jgi:1,4-alpha-glucan branching enzyme
LDEYSLLCFYFIDEWNREQHPYTKLEYGKWELQIPANPDGSCPITHMSEVKVIVKNK